MSNNTHTEKGEYLDVVTELDKAAFQSKLDALNAQDDPHTAPVMQQMILSMKSTGVDQDLQSNILRTCMHAYKSGVSAGLKLGMSYLADMPLSKH